MNLKYLIGLIFIFGFFLILNVGLAQTTDTACTQKYSGYGKCAPDCSDLGSDYLADNSTGLCSSGICCYKLASVPASTETPTDNLNLQVPIFETTSINNLAEYIALLYTYLLIILVPLAIIMVIVGGVSWITAAGNQSKIENAKKYITASFSGLLIGLFSYIFLSLVGIEALKMPGIQVIERQVGGDLIIIDGNVYTQAEANEKLPAGRRGSANAYENMPCPTKANPTFQVYFTHYYTPTYGEKGGYTNFWCNIGMQCSCPKGSSNIKSCVAGDYSWAPCNEFPSSLRPEIDYCNRSASRTKPIGGYTIAADIPRKGRPNACFKKGCKLTIEGIPNVHEIQDTGSIRKIIGLHMDYYVGIGLTGKNAPAGVYTVTITNPEFCLK